MDVHDGVAPVEFFHSRSVGGIAEPRIVIAGEEPDTIGLQRVVGICDLFQRRIDVRKRHRREESEPGRIILHKLRGVLVTRTGEAAGHCLVAKP